MPARNYIEVVEKAMRVFEVLANGEGSKSLGTISAESGLVKSTAFRILFTLRELGYVERNANTGFYALNLKVLGLARGAKAKATLTRVARPFLDALRDELDESVWLAERRGNQVYVVDVAEAHHPLRLLLKLGDLSPIHAAALGKAIAAHVEDAELDEMLAAQPLRSFTPKTITDACELMGHLAEVRRQGYAVNDEETIPGAVAIGVPIFDANGRVFAAVSITAPTTRWQAEKLEATAGKVKACAEDISSVFMDLGYDSR